LRYLIDVMGRDKVCLGSDYPFPLGEHCPGQLIESLHLDAALQEELLFQNALRWLGRQI